MSKPLELVAHLSEGELFALYRAAKDVRTKTHTQVIWLKAQGKETSEIAKLTGYRADWVRQLIRRYNQEGPDSLGDRRRSNGRALYLSEADQAALVAALGGPAPDGGLWNGPKVTAWLRQRLGQKVSDPLGWHYLQRLGFALRQPRPRHLSADSVAQEAFKKTSTSTSKRSARHTPTPRSTSGRKMKPAWVWCRSSAVSG